VNGRLGPESAFSFLFESQDAEERRDTHESNDLTPLSLFQFLQRVFNALLPLQPTSSRPIPLPNAQQAPKRTPSPSSRTTHSILPSSSCLGLLGFSQRAFPFGERVGSGEGGEMGAIAGRSEFGGLCRVD
jgi:hypothetical protein